jgi:cobalt-zinc-cadmium efflux system protein
MHTHGASAATGRVLKWSLIATLAFVVLEAAAGIRAHSLALLSDAGHNFTDALALLLAWFAMYIQRKPADETRTYGYHRAGVLAAFVNALTLLGLALWIFYESYHRLRAPEPVEEMVMLWVAGAGLMVNGGIMWGLRTARRHDINIRSAFMHMMGDALGSAAIVAGALGIHYTGWRRIDPILSIAIACLVIWSARDIVKESLNILLEGLPKGLTLKAVSDAMRSVEGVIGVHDLHIWSLGSSTHALSCHVLIEDVPPSSSDAILKRINQLLSGRFEIHHTTIQFEHMGCEVSGNGCVIPAGAETHTHHHH